MEIHKNLLFLFIKILQFCQKSAITTHIIYINVCYVNIENICSNQAVTIH